MPSVDGDDLDRIHLELIEHRGKDNAIESGRIADRAGIDDSEGNPKTREAIRILLQERHVPIGSCNSGYYIMDSRDEFEETLEDLRGRISGIEARMHHISRAWKHHHPDARESGAEEVEA